MRSPESRAASFARCSSLSGGACSTTARTLASMGRLRLAAGGALVQYFPLSWAWYREGTTDRQRGSGVGEWWISFPWLRR